MFRNQLLLAVVALHLCSASTGHGQTMSMNWSRGDIGARGSDPRLTYPGPNYDPPGTWVMVPRDPYRYLFFGTGPRIRTFIPAPPNPLARGGSHPIKRDPDCRDNSKPSPSSSSTNSSTSSSSGNDRSSSSSSSSTSKDNNSRSSDSKESAPKESHQHDQYHATGPASRADSSAGGPSAHATSSVNTSARGNTGSGQTWASGWNKQSVYKSIPVITRSGRVRVTTEQLSFLVGDKTVDKPMGFVWNKNGLKVDTRFDENTMVANLVLNVSPLPRFWSFMGGLANTPGYQLNIWGMLGQWLGDDLFPIDDKNEKR